MQVGGIGEYIHPPVLKMFLSLVWVDRVFSDGRFWVHRL
jgi:hypothetical protein